MHRSLMALKESFSWEMLCFVMRMSHLMEITRDISSKYVPHIWKNIFPQNKLHVNYCVVT